MIKKALSVLAIAVAPMVGFAPAAQAELGAVGGISPDNGFPIYYANPLVSNGVDVSTVSPGPNGQPLRLSLCLKNNGLCLLPGDVTLTNPALPFPDNYGGTFPDEAFYWTGDASVVTAGGGVGQVIMALEGAFLNGGVVSGDQIVFGRIRLRIDNLIAGETYKITTPFGIFNLVAEAAGRRGINFTEDAGLVQGDFTVVLGAKVGPFLAPVGFDPDAPTVVDAEGVGYIADPAVPTQVTGSVITDPHAFGLAAVPGLTNFFRIEGPGVGNQTGLAASPDRCLDPALGPIATNRSDCVETDLFLISGQIASVFGVAPVRTTYTRVAAGAGRIDILATSAPGETIEASIPGRTIQLFEDPAATGRYFGRFSFNGTTVPLAPEVLLTNVSDVPPTVVASPLTDTVTVQQATFDTTGLNPTGLGALTLRTNSSDNVTAGATLGAVPPTLTASDEFGATLTCSADGVTNLVAELPDNVTVVCPTFAVGEIAITSTAGGAAKQTTVISGPNVSGP